MLLVLGAPRMRGSACIVGARFDAARAPRSLRGQQELSSVQGEVARRYDAVSDTIELALPHCEATFV